MPAGLAGLPLDQVEDLLAAVEDGVVQLEEGRDPFAHGQRGPGLLRLPGLGVGDLDVLGRGDGQLGEWLAGERRDDLLGLPAGGDLPDNALDHARIECPRCSKNDSHDRRVIVQGISGYRLVSS
jgi:hypothetical protein